ncbi:MAG: redoxin domain-containing protein [Planctomycetes bacterium]|nr:redoxin domain-containing protein [Planctomycetota bacterium]
MRMMAMALGALALAPAFRNDLKLGEVVPDITFKDQEGKEFKLSDFREDKDKKIEGQVVVVYFQSRACPVAINPKLVKKIAEPWNDPKSGVKFIAVFTDKWDSSKIVEKYINKHELEYACVFDTGRKGRDHFGAKQVNHTFVLDKTGKLIYRGGFAQMKGTRKAIRETVVEAVKAAQESAEAPQSDRAFAG